jgi:hypothetical protein
MFARQLYRDLTSTLLSTSLSLAGPDVSGFTLRHKNDGFYDYM